MQNLDQYTKKQLMLMLTKKHVEEKQPLSITGMSCKLPGDIQTPAQLWELALNKKHVLGSVPENRWNVDRPDYKEFSSYLTRGGYLRDVSHFDAGFFNIAEQDVIYVDPQHRILLETIWHAIEDANITRQELKNKQVGVFIAISTCEYLHPFIANNLDASKLSKTMILGTTLSASAGRIAYHLGITGPTLTIDTACSSSLVALHYASHSLRRNESDIAIVAGVHLLLSPLSTIVLSKAGLLSNDGESVPFTQNGDGFVRSEGCSALVLKRLVDSKLDNDQPYALLRGSAYGQNGDRAGLTTASGKGQVSVINAALKSANVKPEDIAYIETQNNGCEMAGIIEIEALSDVFSIAKSQTNPLYLGSLKANLGYMEIASGIPGIIKTALALKNSVIPPQLGCDNLDKRIPWDKLPFNIPLKSTPWPTSITERRLAGVSSFGITGTNCHIILESINKKRHLTSFDIKQSRTSDNCDELCLLSANSLVSLKKNTKVLLDYLITNPELKYKDICSTLACHREHFSYRHSFVVNNIIDIQNGLKNFMERDPGKKEYSKKGVSIEFDMREFVGDSVKLIDSIVSDELTGIYTIFCNNLEQLLSNRKDKQISKDEIADYYRLDIENFMFVYYYSLIQYMRKINITPCKIIFNQTKLVGLALFAFGYKKSFSFVETMEIFKSGNSDEVPVSNIPDSLHLVYKNQQYTIRRNEQHHSSVTIPFNNMRPRIWLDTLSILYSAGLNLNWNATRIKNGYNKVTLPGYQFNRKPYWLKNNRWK